MDFDVQTRLAPDESAQHSNNYISTGEMTLSEQTKEPDQVRLVINTILCTYMMSLQI